MSDEISGVFGLRTSAFPIQIAGQDEILREVSFNSRLQNQDVRIYLDAHTLEELHKVAKQSPVNKVLLHGAKVKCSVRKSRDGHVYSVISFDSYPPRPVRIPTSIRMGGIDPNQREAEELYRKYNK